MVDSANAWMLEQEKAFKNFARSATLLRSHVAALGHAIKHGYKIDSDSDVVMQAALALLLVQAPPIEYAQEIAPYMIQKEWQPYLTVTGALYRKMDPKIATAPKTQSRSKDQTDKDNFKVELNGKT